MMNGQMGGMMGGAMMGWGFAGMVLVAALFIALIVVLLRGGKR